MLYRLCIFFLIPFLGFCGEIDLSNFERQTYSQYGEDGVIDKIFEVLEIKHGYCVEFGPADSYTFSNSLQYREKGWPTLLLDGTCEDQSINLYKEWITRENIVELFEKYNVSIEFELLSIDIDSNDWYIWHELGSVYSPKVIIIEFNPDFGPSEDMVVEYDPNLRWQGDSYYGASFLAYFNLGRALGYSLVYSTHLNAIFVRDDLIQDNNLQFKNVNDVMNIYKGPATCAEVLKSLPHISSTELLCN